MTARDIAALFESLEIELVESLHRCLARHQQQAGQGHQPLLSAHVF